MQPRSVFLEICLVSNLRVAKFWPFREIMMSIMYKAFLILQGNLFPYSMGLCTEIVIFTSLDTYISVLFYYIYLIFNIS